jgi:hypothetical protein
MKSEFFLENRIDQPPRFRRDKELAVSHLRNGIAHSTLRLQQPHVLLDLKRYFLDAGPCPGFVVKNKQCAFAVWRRASPFTIDGNCNEHGNFSLKKAWPPLPHLVSTREALHGVTALDIAFCIILKVFTSCFGKILRSALPAKLQSKGVPRQKTSLRTSPRTPAATSRIQLNISRSLFAVWGHTFAADRALTFCRTDP